MKYSDVDIKEARECCKEHRAQCNECPLRRTRETKTHGEITLFCYYILFTMYEDCEEQLCKMKEENIHHEDEYIKWKELKSK